MNRRYTVIFRYTKPGDKKPGPVQRYVLYARDLQEARTLASQYANYPKIELLDVKET